MTDLYANPCCACGEDTVLGYTCDLCGRPVCTECVCSDSARGVPQTALGGNGDPGFLCPSCPGAYVAYIPVAA